MAIVYVVTNLTNGKKYVGQTVQTLKRRQQIHEFHARNKESIGHHVFQAAIAKYGIDAFVWEIVFEHDNIDAINKQEALLIAELNSVVPNGYNISLGGSFSKGGPVEVDCFICGISYKIARGHYNQNVKRGFIFVCSPECKGKHISMRHTGDNNPSSKAKRHV